MLHSRYPDSIGKIAGRRRTGLPDWIDQISPNVPIYSVSGWFDGAWYSNGAIIRYLTRDNKHDRLLLGPWDHGARTNVSPWREEEGPQFNLLAEFLRFFDTHLLGPRKD